MNGYRLYPRDQVLATGLSDVTSEVTVVKRPFRQTSKTWDPRALIELDRSEELQRR